MTNKKSFAYVASLFGCAILYAQDGEFIIDTNVMYVPAYHEQKYASVANGDQYFVVWTDGRYSPDWSFHPVYESDISGARVDASGAVLDPAGLMICTTAYRQEFPSVSFDGTNYLVVWQDYRLTGAGPYDLYGARVNQSGIALDTSGIAISTALNNQQNSAVAFDGVNYLVVWQDDRNGTHDIYGTRVSQSGDVLEPSGIAISTATSNQWFPSVAFDGTNYLVVWHDFRSGVDFDIYGARIDTSGIVLDPSGISISTEVNSQGSPSVAFDGINYLVVWDDMRNGSSYDIYGARVDTSGSVLDPSGIVISNLTNQENYPSITFDGINYMVAWRFQRSDLSYDIYGVRIDTLGAIIDPTGIAVSTASPDQQYPAIASNGTNYLVAWHDQEGLVPYDVRGALVDTSGIVLDPTGITISTAANDQWHSAVAFDGTNHFVVWHDNQDGIDMDIYGMRVDQTGTVLDPSAVAISASARMEKYPSIAFDGMNYLVVWQVLRADTTYDIYGARVNQSGTVLDPSSIAISTEVEDQQYPSLVFDNDKYFVVWEDNRNGPLTQIYGARVDTAGIVLDPGGIGISSEVLGVDHCYARVSSDGTKYFVVWYTYILGPDILKAYGARVDTSGIVLDPYGVTIAPYGEEEMYPSVAFDGTNYFVVWTDLRSTGYENISGTRVNTAGTVLDTISIALTDEPCFQYYPSVVFDGTNYVVMWEQRPSGMTCYDIYGAKITPQMQVFDTFAVSLQTGNQYLPRLALGVDSQVLVTYSGFTDSINGHAANTMRTWANFYPFTGSEEANGMMPEPGICWRVYPNPFNQTIEIEFQLSGVASSEKIVASMKIYDISGRLIRDLPILTSNFSLPTSIVWDGKDDRNQRLPIGVYFVRLEYNDVAAVAKVVLLER